MVGLAPEHLLDPGQNFKKGAAVPVTPGTPEEQSRYAEGSARQALENLSGALGAPAQYAYFKC